jgi:formyltetrahydrofolate deformylase
MTSPSPSRSYSLTLSCPDRPGIVHGVSGVLVGLGANITESQQYGSPDTGRFFMRAEEFDMDYSLAEAERRTRTLIMVSKAAHCLNDLLFQHRSGTLAIDIPVIVSNHRDLEGLAAFYGIEFHHIPVTADTKESAEAALRALMAEHEIELVVLARYMQILSDQLCEDLLGRAINIHHSFLPSFKGARPYHQAHARGVKLIGATAHYVTGALDEGPIVEQEVIRVDHARTAEQLTAIGRELEGRALVQAVQWHAEGRVLLDGRRTVVFN